MDAHACYVQPRSLANCSLGICTWGSCCFTYSVLNGTCPLSSQMRSSSCNRSLDDRFCNHPHLPNEEHGSKRQCRKPKEPTLRNPVPRGPREGCWQGGGGRSAEGRGQGGALCPGDNLPGPSQPFLNLVQST